MLERISKTPLVKEVFPMTSSIFSKMNYNNLPMDAGQLDLLFYTDYGLKTIAPLVSTLKGTDETLSSEKLTLLATMLLNKYRNKWDRYKEVYDSEYDPMHNYLDEYSEDGSTSEDEANRLVRDEDYSETIIGDNSYTRTDNLTESNTGTSSSTNSASQSDEGYGFNSSTAVGIADSDLSGSDSSSSSNSTTNTGTQVTDEDRDERRTITDDRTDTETKDKDGTHHKEGYHRGNIGNISTQKLLLEEIELWRWNFVEEVLHDARDFLTLPLYSL